MGPDTVRNIHDRAMDLVQEAFVLKSRGNTSEAMQKFKRAFLLERAAADRLAEEKNIEPTRSILHRSAATLALDCNKTSEAVRLARRGLAGDPPEEVAGELRDVIAKAEERMRHQ
jgi:hypothetical protein